MPMLLRTLRRAAAALVPAGRAARQNAGLSTTAGTWTRVPFDTAAVTGSVVDADGYLVVQGTGDAVVESNVDYDYEYDQHQSRIVTADGTVLGIGRRHVYPNAPRNKQVFVSTTPARVTAGTRLGVEFWSSGSFAGSNRVSASPSTFVSVDAAPEGTKMPPLLAGFQHTNAASNATASLIQSPYPSGAVASDVIIACVTMRRGTVTTLAPVGDGWTEIATYTVSGTRVSWFWALRGSAGAAYFQAGSAATSSATIDLWALRGADPVNPIAATTTPFTATGGSASVGISAITNCPASCFLVMALTYTPTASSRTVDWRQSTEQADVVLGTLNAYHGVSVAHGGVTSVNGSGEVDAVISASQANRTAMLVAIRPA